MTFEEMLAKLIMKDPDSTEPPLMIVVEVDEKGNLAGIYDPNSNKVPVGKLVPYFALSLEDQGAVLASRIKNQIAQQVKKVCANFIYAPADAKAKTEKIMCWDESKPKSKEPLYDFDSKLKASREDFYVEFIVCEFNNNRVLRFEAKNGRIIKIGRDSRSDIHINDSTVGRMHSVIEINTTDNHPNLTLVDLGNEPLTEVNGARVVKQKLNVGDRIKIGQHIITFLAIKEPLYEV